MPLSHFKLRGSRRRRRVSRRSLNQRLWPARCRAATTALQCRTGHRRSAVGSALRSVRHPPGRERGDGDAGTGGRLVGTREPARSSVLANRAAVRRRRHRDRTVPGTYGPAKSRPRTAETGGDRIGTTNALRHLGTVLGIAVLGSVFSAYGSYATASTFVAGMTAAMIVGSVVLASGSVLILFARSADPNRRDQPAGREA